MGPRDAILAPFRAAGAVARAADDLHTLAERARRDPDPVDEAGERLDRLSSQLDALIGLAGGLHDSSQAIVSGGRDLERSAEGLEARAREIIDGGQDLTAVGEEIASSLRVVLAALPQVLEGLSSVEELEESVGTVAETVEPLQGLTDGVGRMSQRLSRAASG